jgi:hypothetical protein
LTGFELRPLSLGEILDRAFLMYRRHLLLFLGIAAIPQLLTLGLGLLQIFLGPLTSVRTVSNRTVLMPNFDLTSILLALVGLVLGVIVYALAQGGTILAVADLYLGRQTNITDSLRRAWSELGTLIGTSLLNGLAVAAGFIALFIPGIYILCRLLVCLPAALIENRTAGDSLSRSWNLTKGFAGRAFLLLVLYFVVAAGIGLLFGIPIGYLTGILGFAASAKIILVLQQVSNVIVSVLVQPLLLIGTSIFYFDLRVRKEAFDIQFLMDPDSEHMSRGEGGLPSILS